LAYAHGVVDAGELREEQPDCVAVRKRYTVAAAEQAHDLLGPVGTQQRMLFSNLDTRMECPRDD